MTEGKSRAQRRAEAKRPQTKDKELKEVPIKVKWFSFSGISTEVKRIRWPKGSELLASTGKVLLFCILFGAFFVLCDLVVSKLLLWIGVGA
jgi:preprotein translocase SecE subunit